MEYDKYLVSLYSNSKFSGLSKDVLQVAKLADKVQLILNRNYSNGFLFILNNKDCHIFELQQSNKYIFNAEFQFYNDYLFCLITDNEWLYGKRGKINFSSVLIDEIKVKHEELKLKKLEKIKFKYDKNFIVDRIINTMFGENSLLYFDEVKHNLEKLFSSQARQKELESIIPTSKFIELVEDNYAGIIYKEGRPKAFAIGFKNLKFDAELDSSRFQYFNKNNEGDENIKQGYFISFRRVSDGEQVII